MKIISFLWQLPQNIMGLLAVVALGAYKDTYESDPAIYVHYRGFFSSVSLGGFIIVNGHKYTERTVLHEIGHQRQSRILGWLYLPLIGLPSLIGNILHRFIKFDYYRQPWEAWADRLGGVKR